MKKRVWIVSWYGTQSGGLERIVRILNQILAGKYDVEIIDIPYISRYQGWKLLLRFKHRLALMITFSLFVRWIAGKDDIIITHGQNAPFVKSNFLFDHGSILSLKREMGEFVYGGSSLFEYIAVKRAKVNVAVSEWTREQIVKNYHVNEKKIVVLNNCVETDMFYPLPRKKADKTVILFCGRLEEAKGLKQLLQLAELVEKHTKFELKIAANDECNAYLFENRSHIRVECGIPTEKMNDFYNSGDVLFVPSKCEGFGMGIVESLAAGVPVVTNEVGIVRDLMKDKCPAVKLIKKDSSIEEILELAYTIAEQYCDRESRISLHDYMEKNYGLSAYGVKLNKMIEGEKYA